MKFPALSVLLVVMFAGQLVAADPTIDALLKNIPVLRCDDKDITSFRCTMQSNMPFETDVLVQFAWRNKDEFLAVATVGEEKTPFCLLAQQKSLIFDASVNKALVHEGMRPKITIGLSDAQTIKLLWGLTGGKDSEVSIDLPSLLTEPAKKGKITQDKAGRWCLATDSPTGNTRTVAVFDDAEGFPLRAVELRSADDDSVLLAVRDIVLNQEDNRMWPGFPGMEDMPAGLAVEFELMDEETKDLAFLQLMNYIVRAATSQVAIRNANWRQEKIFEGVDWEQAAKTATWAGKISQNGAKCRPKSRGKRLRKKRFGGSSTTTSCARREKMFCRTTFLLAMLLVGLSALTAHAAEPTVEQLIRAVPILCPTNDTLSDFRANIFVPSELPFTVDVGWARQKSAFMMISNRENTPFAILRDDKAVLLEITRKTITSFEGVTPSFQLSSQEGKFNYTVGMPTRVTKDDDSIELRLPDFFPNPNDAQLNREGVEHWRLRWKSPSGCSNMSAWFADKPGYPVTRVEAKSAANNSLVFAFRDIRINEETPTWVNLPSLDDAPMGVTVVELPKAQTLEGASKVAAVFLIVMMSQQGLIDEDARGFPFKENTDWNVYAANQKELGPIFAKMLRDSNRNAAKEAPGKPIRR